MSNTSTADTGVLTDYPVHYQTHYDRAVWLIGEDGDEGMLAAGHDRRSYAALNALALSEENYRYAAALKLYEQAKQNPQVSAYGPPGRDLQPMRGRTVVATWALLHTRCGCTEAEHAQHETDDIDCITDVCTHAMLPPCTWDGNQHAFAWIAEWVPPGTPSALPVLRVTL